MFAIIIDNSTAPLIGAMNNGVVPQVDPEEATYFIYKGEDTPPEIISSEAFYMLRTEEIWTPLDFAIWKK